MPDPSPDFEQARAAFLQAVQDHEAGRLQAAEAGYERARALMPGRPSVLLNLAQLRLTLGRPEAVPDDLAPLLAQAPDHVEAWTLLARAWEAQDRPAEALSAVDRLIALRPGDATLHFRRGQLLGRLARADEALQAYDQALALDTGHAAAWTQRGSLLREAGRLDDAALAFRQALAHGGDAELNRWFLAAVQGPRPGADAPADASAAADAGPVASDLPLPAPPRYVQTLFDTYAEGFDTHLVQALGYRVPEQLVALWRDRGTVHREMPTASPEVLDLGCGTGLCAQALADVPRGPTPGASDRTQPGGSTIDGVDLSPRMVAAAQARGLYRRVDEGDVVAWLQTCTQRYDLVLAADVFIYIGDLAPVFRGVQRVLAPSGRFVFSVESTDTGVELGPSLRYRHSGAYLCQLAADHGFDVDVMEPAVLRHEQQRPIEGLLVCLRPRVGVGPGA